MRIAADFDNFRKRQSRDQEDQRLQITAYSLILDRRVGHYRLPDGWQVIAAGNARVKLSCCSRKNRQVSGGWRRESPTRSTIL
jgi:hypothetical protein